MWLTFSLDVVMLRWRARATWRADPTQRADMSESRARYRMCFPESTVYIIHRAGDVDQGLYLT